MPPALPIALALAIALAAGGRLLLWQQAGVQDTGSVFALLLGESRRAFADQVFLKADAYFHQGYYPSVFDLALPDGKTHMAKETEGHDHDDHSHTPSEREYRDWLERFGSHFYPAEHRHMEKFGDAREILPWLRLSAELDPHRVDTYTVAAYWLRERLNKVNDAEAFLRDGLRANPGSYEILFELGRLYAENNRDVPRARAVLELAIEKWLRQEAGKPNPDELAYGHILAQLAALEERTGNLPQAINHFTRLKRVSPAPDTVQKRIEELQTKLSRP
ncbi:MAG: Uncharacterized protein FD161_2288 [Limisphaerales bacterium]|nr:MAG: Uncharacterized protein FD161_2288 [Limisphaerales bacterium]KAG0508800.1 MAG: Uncharacterized protein E1N63_2090 [Limisphaerales bacterium]TXT50509.1 MAG: Uncharacterized protein FD140_2293 [Limisphaerales bacterium]